MSALPNNYDFYHRTAVQKALNEKTGVKPPLTLDGSFGNASTAALQTFQTNSGIPTTGVYDAATQALLEPFIASKYILYASFVQAAGILGVDAASIQAVCATETSGAGFFSNGECTILFEREWMYKQLVTSIGQSGADNFAQSYPNLVATNGGGYIGGIAEYGRLNQAITLNPECAILSASWGMFQIMGFNFAECGYANVDAYVADMKSSETAQLDAFIHFVQNYRNGALLTALQNKNWSTFALDYNGSGNVAAYSSKMASNYTTFSSTPDSGV